MYNGHTSLSQQAMWDEPVTIDKIETYPIVAVVDAKGQMAINVPDGLVEVFKEAQRKEKENGV